MQYDLSGKRALITGSSRGIGSAIAKDLARNGAEVVIHYAGDREQADEIKRTIEKIGAGCSILQADLCTPEHAQRLMAEAGEVDILVLNASVQYRNKWDKITIEEFYRQINCNLLSGMLMIQRAVPYMQQKKWGRIITIGSVQELKPHPDMLVYSASKAAQTNMMKSLALQLAADGITVNNIAPGVIYTDRNRDALADEAYAQKVMASIPLGYYGEPVDCAGMVTLLCSEAGRYITGQSIFIDGGKSL